MSPERPALAVDDSALSRRNVLRRHLEAEGFRVAEAAGRCCVRP